MTDFLVVLFQGRAGNGSRRWEQIRGTTAGKVSLREELKVELLQQDSLCSL